MELRLSVGEEPSILNNIYVGKVERILENINAAFVSLGKEGKWLFSTKGAGRGYLYVWKEGKSSPSCWR